jgi:hypothetical protein
MSSFTATYAVNQAQSDLRLDLNGHFFRSLSFHTPLRRSVS